MNEDIIHPGQSDKLQPHVENSVRLSSAHNAFIEVYNPAAFVVPDLSWTKIPHQTVAIDPMKMWDAPNKRVIIPFDGLYRVEARLRHEDTTGTYRYLLGLFVNGVVVRYMCDHLGGGGTMGLTPSGSIGITEIYLRKGDYVEVDMYHNIGSNRNYPIAVTQDQSNFSVRCVRRYLLP